VARERLPAGRGFPTASEITSNPNPARIVAKGKVKPAKKSQVILTLDLSTSCVGWAVGEEPRLVNYGKFVFTDDREFGEKMLAFKAYLLTIFTTYRPDRVIVEKPISRHGNTTALHNQLLGVVRLLAVEALEYEIMDRHLVSPRTVKALLEVKAGDDHNHNKKIMVEHVNKAFGLKLQFHENSKLQTEDDIADAIAILLACWTRK
jgi:Holliday junction resolvasome RuvABC endonuclease subunit